MALAGLFIPTRVSRSRTGEETVWSLTGAEHVLRRHAAEESVLVVALLLLGLSLWVDHLVLLHGVHRRPHGGERRTRQHVIHDGG